MNIGYNAILKEGTWKNKGKAISQIKFKRSRFGLLVSALGPRPHKGEEQVIFWCDSTKYFEELKHKILCLTFCLIMCMHWFCVIAFFAFFDSTQKIRKTVMACSSFPTKLVMLRGRFHNLFHAQCQLLAQKASQMIRQKAQTVWHRAQSCLWYWPQASGFDFIKVGHMVHMAQSIVI